jgi:predicted MFS family arabinose efflux permease
VSEDAEHRSTMPVTRRLRLASLCSAVARPADRRGTAMWAICAVVYLVAVFHRTSLGVAAKQASDRFNIGPTELSALVCQQLLIYTVVQIPAGRLVDRVGPRRVLVVALTLMAAGQCCTALSSSYAVALVGRALLGTGDATVFVSVIRVVAVWCPERRVAVLVQLTAILGIVGNLISTIPLVASLDRAGWTVTFLSGGLATAAMAVPVYCFVRDAPNAAADDISVRAEQVHPTPEPPDVVTVSDSAGVRVGTWMVILTCPPILTFTTLWGFPYLTTGERLDSDAAAQLMTLMLAANIAAGPVFGVLAARRPGLRLPLTATVGGSVAVLWIAVLAWPGSAPTSLLVALLVVLGTCGPAAMLGLDVVRTSSPSNRIATACALANCSGIAVALLVILGLGAISEILSRIGFAESDALRSAFWLQVLFAIVAGWRLLTWAHRCRSPRQVIESRPMRS